MKNLNLMFSKWVKIFSKWVKKLFEKKGTEEPKVNESAPRNFESPKNNSKEFGTEMMNNSEQRNSNIGLYITLIILGVLFYIKMENLEKSIEFQDIKNYFERQEQIITRLENTIQHMNAIDIDDKTKALIKNINEDIRKVRIDNLNNIKELKKIYTNMFIAGNFEDLKEATGKIKKDMQAMREELNEIKMNLDFERRIKDQISQSRIKIKPDNSPRKNRILLNKRKIYLRSPIQILFNQVSITLLNSSSRLAEFSISTTETRIYKRTIDIGDSSWFEYEGRFYFLILTGSGEDWAEISVIRKL